MFLNILIFKNKFNDLPLQPTTRTYSTFFVCEKQTFFDRFVHARHDGDDDIPGSRCASDTNIPYLNLLQEDTALGNYLTIYTKVPTNINFFNISKFKNVFTKKQISFCVLDMVCAFFRGPRRHWATVALYFTFGKLHAKWLILDRFVQI